MCDSSFSIPWGTGLQALLSHEFLSVLVLVNESVTKAGGLGWVTDLSICIHWLIPQESDEKHRDGESKGLYL